MSDLSDDDKRRIDEWAESLKVAWPWWLPLVILANRPVVRNPQQVRNP